MKKFLTIFALFFVATFTFAQKSGDKITFTATDMSGAAITSDIFAKNKVTMVNIWGTFCGPCIREMPDLANLAKTNAAKGVQVVGIPIDIVDRNGKIISRTKKDGEAIIKQIDAMKKAILGRAFRGELGTNDPSEASAELAR